MANPRSTARQALAGALTDARSMILFGHLDHARNLVGKVCPFDQSETANMGMWKLMIRESLPELHRQK